MKPRHRSHLVEPSFSPIDSVKVKGGFKNRTAMGLEKFAELQADTELLQPGIVS